MVSNARREGGNSVLHHAADRALLHWISRGNESAVLAAIDKDTGRWLGDFTRVLRKGAPAGESESEGDE